MVHFKRHLGPEYMSFWDGYQFKDSAEERLFLDRRRPRNIQATQLWGIITLVQLASVAFYVGYRQRPLSLHLASLPYMVTCLSCLILVTFVPWTKKHVAVVASIAVIFMSGCAIFSARLHITEGVERYMEELAPALGNNTAALQKLEQFVLHSVSKDIVSSHMDGSWFYIILLIYIGFSRSMLLATILIPIIMIAMALLLTPTSSMGSMLIRTVTWGAVALLAIPLSINLSLTRRAEFVMERRFKADLEEAVDAGRKADSILNHTLKNTMSEAAGEIELCLESPDVEEKAGHLQRSLFSLQRGMRSCHARQAYLHLSAGRYTLLLRPVQLSVFTRGYAAGRNLRCTTEDFTVLMDATLCGLIVDNAINNAFKHGHPDNPDVTFTTSTTRLGPGQPNRMLVTFCVENVASPIRPTITPDYVTAVLSGTATSTSAGAAVSSAFSDRIGLQQSYVAGAAHSMTLSLEQHGNRVVFRASFEAEVGEPLAAPRDEAWDHDIAQFPSDLHVYCIDDSEGVRRLLNHNFRAHAATQNVRVYGSTWSDTSAFVEAVLERADIAVLDQHLEYGCDTNILGTDLVAQLRTKGYRGLICVRSANSAPEDRAVYAQAGAHCSFGKDQSMRDMIAEMKVVYVREILHKPLSMSAASRPEDTVFFRPLSTPRAWVSLTGDSALNGVRDDALSTCSL